MLSWPRARLLLCLAGSWVGVAPALMKLGQEGVSDLVKTGSLDVLVLVGTAWCEQCAMIEPHLTRLQTVLNARGLPLMIASLDATRFPELPERHGVAGYPTLLLWRTRYTDEEPLTFPGSDLQPLHEWLEDVLAGDVILGRML